MLVEVLNRMKIEYFVLDKAGSPAFEISPPSSHVIGDFRNCQDLERIAALVDVLTIEIEHVSFLGDLQAKFPALEIHPSPATIATIQDKYRQKVVLSENTAVPLPRFVEVDMSRPGDFVRETAANWGYPLMLKAKRLAYDGRGNYVIKREDQIPSAIAALSASGELYLEEWVHFERELAVMIARDIKENLSCFPVVESFQNSDSICEVVVAPARVDGLVALQAKKTAEMALSAFTGAGIFGVEMFLLENGQVLVNEVAPRVHNTGHFTIEACRTSQFEQHIRAVLGFELGDSLMTCPAALMVNLLGAPSRGLDQLTDQLQVAVACGASVHWYGKKECKKGRKMAHVTFTGDSMDQLLVQSTPLLNQALAPDQVQAVSTVTQTPLVAVIMGSDSDLKVMEAAIEVLKNFKVPFEVAIVSAHRTPERMLLFGKEAHLRGFKVIIAGAGGAAHLPGMVAAVTPLPVIGVPVALKHLDGIDSLHSIVQMPVFVMLT